MKSSYWLMMLYAYKPLRGVTVRVGKLVDGSNKRIKTVHLQALLKVGQERFLRLTELLRRRKGTTADLEQTLCRM